jgi:hypothetical protein
MPLRNPDALENLLAPLEEVTDLCFRELADAGTDRLKGEVAERTPVDTNPYRHREGRPRGTLRDSLERVPGLREGTRRGFSTLTGTVRFTDPVASLVEDDTPPHTIRAKDGGMLHFQTRYGYTTATGDFRPPGSWVTVEEIQHPGTKGAHMLSRGALATEMTIDRWAIPALTRWRNGLRTG